MINLLYFTYKCNEVKTMKMTIAITGAAGDGINTVSQLLLKELKVRNYYIHTMKDYMSRVRGGLNTTFVRFSDQPIHAQTDHIDILVSFNQQGIKDATPRIDSNTIIIAPFDESLINKNGYFLDVASIKSETKNPKSTPMATLGALFAHLGFNDYTLSNKKWDESVTAKNRHAYDLGFAKVTDPIEVSELPHKEQMLISGNEAVGLGAMCADVTFYCAYPMAPSTGIMHYLSKQEAHHDLVVEQAEDEIAAAMAAMGAGAAGVRAMTGTSGGGFALMAEALGFAGIGEIPVVMVDVQRPGPATGLPTRTEQGDLSFLLTTSQGEFARIILAPHTVEDSFYQTILAHDLAEKYRVPVIILADEYLADSTVSMDKPDASAIRIDRHWYSGDAKDYKHYDYDKIVNQRAYPGFHKDMLIMNDSHVHFEDGHVTEDADLTIKNKHKLMKKLSLIKDDLDKPTIVGPADAKTLLVSWGSVSPIVTEAMEGMTNVKHMPFHHIFPLKTEAFKAALASVDKVVIVEQNFTQQFGTLLQQHVPFEWDDSILKYDGRQFTVEDIRKALEVL